MYTGGTHEKIARKYVGCWVGFVVFVVLFRVGCFVGEVVVMVFMSKKEIADAERAHKVRNDKIWKGDFPITPDDAVKCKKLTEFFEEYEA